MGHDKLRVRFDDPENGSIGVSIEGEGIAFRESFSYAAYDSFFDLVTALSLVMEGEGEYAARWLVGSPEVDIRFRRSGADVVLDVVRIPGGTVLRFGGGAEDVVVPFWRALRDLESRFSPEDLEKRWHRTFPSEELRRLTFRLGK